MNDSTFFLISSPWSLIIFAPRFHRLQGAAFTFNARSYLEFIKTLRTIPGPSAIPFPTFDHALKDPLPSPTPILSHHRVIVVEGLYCLANQGDWNEASELFDVKIFVECDRAMARERVIKRNFEAGVEPTLEQTIVRGKLCSRKARLSFFIFRLDLVKHSSDVLHVIVS